MNWPPAYMTVIMVTMMAWSLYWRTIYGAIGARRPIPIMSISMITKMRLMARRLDGWVSLGPLEESKTGSLIMGFSIKWDYTLWFAERKLDQGALIVLFGGLDLPGM